MDPERHNHLLDTLPPALPRRRGLVPVSSVRQTMPQTPTLAPQTIAPPCASSPPIYPARRLERLDKRGKVQLLPSSSLCTTPLDPQNADTLQGRDLTSNTRNHLQDLYYTYDNGLRCLIPINRVPASASVVASRRIPPETPGHLSTDTLMESSTSISHAPDSYLHTPDERWPVRMGPKYLVPAIEEASHVTSQYRPAATACRDVEPDRREASNQTTFTTSQSAGETKGPLTKRPEADCRAKVMFRDPSKRSRLQMYIDNYDLETRKREEGTGVFDKNTPSSPVFLKRPTQPPAMPKRDPRVPTDMYMETMRALPSQVWLSTHKDMFENRAAEENVLPMTPRIIPQVPPLNPQGPPASIEEQHDLVKRLQACLEPSKDIQDPSHKLEMPPRPTKTTLFPEQTENALNKDQKSSADAEEPADSKERVSEDDFEVLSVESGNEEGWEEVDSDEDEWEVLNDPRP